MKLHPTETGARILADITSRQNRQNRQYVPTATETYQPKFEQPKFDTPFQVHAANRTLSTAAYNAEKENTNTNNGSPFRTKSWQNKLWRQYYRRNPIRPNPVCYMTPDGRRIESVVIRYFVIRKEYNMEFGTSSRAKVINEYKFCRTYDSIVDTILTLLYDIDALTAKVEKDQRVATYTMTFRTLVRYSDGTFDSTPTSFQDVMDILGLHVINRDGQYQISQNPDVMWFPMQRVIRGEYK